MSDKTVFYKDRPISSSTITDFYTRLNVLRSLGGLGGYTVFNPQGSALSPSNVTDIQDKVLATRNALSFLNSISLNAPTTPSSGVVVKAPTNIAKVEKEIGTLESACFTFKGGNRSTFFGTNAGPNTFIFNCPTVKTNRCDSVCGFHCGNVNGTHRQTFCGPNNTSFFSAVTNHSSRHGTFKASVNATFNSSNRTDGRDHTYWLYHSPNAIKSAGKQTVKSGHNRSNFKTFGNKAVHSSNKTGVHSSFKSSVKCAANNSAFQGANFAPNFSTVQFFCFTNRGTVNETVNASVCSSVHSSFFQTVHSQNWNFTINYRVNHGVFRVEGIDF